MPSQSRYQASPLLSLPENNETNTPYAGCSSCVNCSVSSAERGKKAFTERVDHCHQAGVKNPCVKGNLTKCQPTRKPTCWRNSFARCLVLVAGKGPTDRFGGDTCDNVFRGNSCFAPSAFEIRVDEYGALSSVVSAV